MRAMKSMFVLLAATLAFAGPARAQQENADKASEGSAGNTDTVAGDRAAAKKRSFAPPIEMQYFRAPDQRGINVFEPPKDDGVPYTGFKLNFGAAFTQQFQSLAHRNAAAPNVVNDVDQNELIEIGSGFNNANANLYLNAQLAPGIRVALTTYLSSRHHPETGSRTAICSWTSRHSTYRCSTT